MKAQYECVCAVGRVNYILTAVIYLQHLTSDL